MATQRRLLPLPLLRGGRRQDRRSRRCRSSSLAQWAMTQRRRGELWGLIRCPAEHLSQPYETVGPARFVQPKAFLRCEITLRQKNLAPLTSVLERQRDDRLAIVGIGRIPSKRVRQTGGRIDLQELSQEVEEIAIRRLHRDAIPGADARVELNAGGGEASGAPPFREFPRIAQPPVDDPPGERQNTLEPQRQPIA